MPLLNKLVISTDSSSVVLEEGGLIQIWVSIEDGLYTSFTCSTKSFLENFYRVMYEATPQWGKPNWQPLAHAVSG